MFLCLFNQQFLPFVPKQIYNAIYKKKILIIMGSCVGTCFGHESKQRMTEIATPSSSTSDLKVPVEKVV